MKGAALLTAAAGLVGSALAGGVHHRHGHANLHRRGAQTCGCTVKTITMTGEPTLVPEPVTEKTTTVRSTSYTTVTVSVTPSEVLPTAVVTVYPTPGTYTIEPTTIIVDKTTTVCGATTTAVSPGEHTYGGVTTVVETATTITCPIATVKPVGSTFTSVIEKTTFVCPTPGTYTVGPSTTSVSKSTVIVYPTPETITPGTYTQPGATVTVTETDYVYVCPKPTGIEPPKTDKPTTPANPPANPPANKPPPPPSNDEPKPTKKPDPAPAPAPSKGPEPPLGGGEKWGMTYSPYNNDGQCKGASDVKKDIQTIKEKGFKTVRVYSSDCDGLQNVGNACKEFGLRMIIGIFISNTGIQGAQKQVTDIVQWGQWGMVDLVVVGNEAIFQGHADAGSLASFIASCKATFKKAGYNGPVTTTEPLNIWQANAGQLCGVIDVLGANIHPFFNAGVAPSEAGKFAKGQMDILEKLCNKKVVNLETGWPNGGGNNGKAVSGASEQVTAIKSIVKEIGSNSVFFSFTNDLWKEPGPLGVEQNWGCINVFK
ncbi:hypothetical protein UREG_02702 [Uncinocarpus reesii 1704]|uniref:Probable beta-glucosidase btgE n=1 Tax=Uncinocarpus reesii (strain UAMH 1704) TaxID=336963 RepID=C4JHC9_UNCRE|nr:uncharacterized protein UREG_02702 [Uncinocarpus reesii 1704]EEP77853.1 hypothetical protein UREG_02702 [Uncinocarpus reesii 1704]